MNILNTVIPQLYEICIGICMSEYRNEMVKTFIAEATSLKFKYTAYVFFLNIPACGRNDYFLNA